MSYGDVLSALCLDAEEQLILVAPFIKRATLERVLDSVSPAVPVCCVTRWIPTEIIAGVSDLEVWPYLRERGNATLSLRSNLHAKYYRADNSCLVGSANLTHAALGWRERSNLELLLPLSASEPALKSFELDLIDGTTQVTEDLHREYVRVVQELRSVLPPVVGPENLGVLQQPSEPNAGEYVSLKEWIPRLRHPEHLYDAYRGDLEKLTRATRDDAIRDLRMFTIPAGLGRVAFNAHVRLELLQMPVVRSVDEFVGVSRRFGAMRAHLARGPWAVGTEFDAARAWQTIMRWLLYFAGTRYKSWQANYSEIFVKRSI